jgi:putative acetyltransferase
VTDVAGGTIAVEDPRADDVRALLERHLSFANEHSPPEDVHALDVEALAHPSVTFLTYREEGVLLGVGALKDLGAGHGELKSMHTSAAARGRGVAGALVTRLVALARERGLTRLSLETGTPDAFTPARSLYARHGFVECGPFGDYVLSSYSTFMTREV